METNTQTEVTFRGRWGGKWKGTSWIEGFVPYTLIRVVVTQRYTTVNTYCAVHSGFMVLLHVNNTLVKINT